MTDSDNVVSFGEYLRQRRESARMSISSCANVMSLDPRTWQRWEQQDTPPHEKNLPSIAYVLGIPLPELREVARAAAKNPRRRADPPEESKPVSQREAPEREWVRPRVGLFVGIPIAAIILLFLLTVLARG